MSSRVGCRLGDARCQTDDTVSGRMKLPRRCVVIGCCSALYWLLGCCSALYWLIGCCSALYWLLGCYLVLWGFGCKVCQGVVLGYASSQWRNEAELLEICGRGYMLAVHCVQ